ncbi:hypothetical protein [Laspinema palackyanum]|uniref:hypothetical protein n=1 Tax=Laspinema palackyanum TaxID=3231601 RepID=UPI00345CA760|nr:hypothetical protein [Laspinema sp. D2c]
MVSTIYYRWQEAMGPSSTGVEMESTTALNAQGDRGVCQLPPSLLWVFTQKRFGLTVMRSHSRIGTIAKSRASVG